MSYEHVNEVIKGTNQFISNKHTLIHTYIVHPYTNTYKEQKIHKWTRRSNSLETSGYHHIYMCSYIHILIHILIQT